MKKRSFVKWAALTSVLGMTGHVGAQSTWPNKPIKLVVPFPPGGSVDVFVRALLPRMGELLGQPIVVDYRAGAGGAIGLDAVAKSPADGYTIGMGSPGALVAVPHMTKVPYDVDKDFIFVARIVRVPAVIVTSTNSGITSIKDLVDKARASPGVLNYGHAGQGTLVHLVGELFKREAKVDITQVPFKGAAPAVQALMGDQLQTIVADLAAVSTLLTSGKIKALAVTSPQRSPLLPDVPTVAEAGYPGAVFESEYGIVAPKGLPADVLSRLTSAVDTAINSPAVKDTYVQVGAVAAPSTSAEYRASVIESYERWGAFIREQKIVMA